MQEFFEFSHDFLQSFLTRLAHEPPLKVIFYAVGRLSSHLVRLYRSLQSVLAGINHDAL